jgi:glycosyltransferase involved in cell wall biosynthesis
MRLKEKYDKPLVITGHGYDVYKLPFYSEWWTNEIRIIGNSANLVITVSEGNRKKLLEIGIPNAKIKILPNGSNSKLFYKLDKALIRKEKGIPEQSKVLVSVGNLEEVKGHKDLIEAVKYLKKEYPEILCYIIGGGSLQDYLKSLIRECDLEDNVFLVGYLTHEKINKWMNLSDLFVLPSLQESFGIVQLEAFATGTPVIGTRTVGSRELIKSDENGLLTSIGNPKEMAENIKKGLEREWDEDNILNYVEGYSWQRIGRETAQEYEKIL